MHPCRILLLVLGTVTWLMASDAHAHHSGIWNSFKVAHRTRDYREMHRVFSEDAWEGRTGKAVAKDSARNKKPESKADRDRKKHTVAGKDLTRLTREAASVEFNPGNQPISKDRHIMGLRLIDRDQKSYWVYLLLEPTEGHIRVGLPGYGFRSHWRVIRLTTSREEAEKYFPQGMRMFRPDRKGTGGSIVHNSSDSAKKTK